MSINDAIELVGAKDSWTVADEIALDLLPHEVQRLVARALKHRGAAPDLSAKADAYDEGFEDACAEYEMLRPMQSNPYRSGRTSGLRRSA